MNDGTKQRERTPAALDPTRIGVDEWRLPDLVAMSEGLAASLHYVEPDNQPAGDWSGLFAADESLVLARILSFDRREARARLLEDFAATPPDKLVREIGMQARTFDAWLESLERIGSPSTLAVSQLMETMIRSRLQHDLASIWPAFYALDPAPPGTWPAHTMTSSPRIEPAAGMAAAAELPAAPSGAAAIDDDTRRAQRERLRSQLASIAGAIARLQEMVQEELPRSMASGTHDPAAGMLIAFLRLYGVVQGRVNGFTRRHTDFYYRDCLYATPRPAHPDRVHLAFRRGTDGRDVVVRRDALFAAGKDAAGRDILFRADDELAVGTARVAALCTLRRERDPLTSPEREFGYATRVVAATLPLARGKAAGPMPCWPLFGGKSGTEGGDAAHAGQDAALGLVVASRQLFLQEGKRRIQLTLRLAERLESDAGVRDAIQRHAAAAAPIADLLMPPIEQLCREVAARRPPNWPPLSTGTIADRARRAAWTLAPLLAALPAQADPATDATWSAMHTLLQDERRRLLRWNAPRDARPDDAPTLPDSTLDECLAQLAAVRGELLAHTETTVAPLQALYERFAALEPVHAAPTSGAARMLAALASADAADCLAHADRRAHRYLHRFLLSQAAAAPDRAAFFVRLGRFFRHWLFADDDSLTTRELAHLRERYAQLFAGAAEAKPGIDEGDPLCLIHRKELPDKRIVWITPNRELIFDRLVNRLFTVSVSTAQGWFHIQEAYAVRAATDGAAVGTGAGIGLVASLQPQDPAVVGCLPAVHGNEWDTALPLLRLTLNAGARVYGADLVGPALLSAVEIAVDVAEVRTLSLGNQLGRIDPAKPFHPFGPLPDLASYLVVGSAEMARKQLTAFGMRLKWAGLPRGDEGFGVHYRGYDSAFRNDSFAASVSLLRDGQWKKLGGARQSMPLFACEADSETLSPHIHLRIDEMALEGQSHPTDEYRADAPYAYDLAARNGFFKFQLVSPEAAFGHAEYPHLLGRVIAANARRRKPLPIPNPPYTPLIEGITLDYRAAGVIRLDRPADNSGNLQSEKLFHLHPFGVREIHPAQSRDTPTVLPQHPQDGNIYIGIDNGLPGDTVTLLFHLRDEEARETGEDGTAADEAGPPVWRYLVGDEWAVLPSDRIVADSTGGFLTSGIVQLVLPDDIDSEHSILDSGRFWLHLATDRAPTHFASLIAIHAQALSATRVLDDRPIEAIESLPAGSVKSALATIPGVTGLEQIGASFGMRPSENDAQLYTRMGERLRHKNRASTAWDMERLVLEEFPHVFKAKCLPHTVSPLTHPDAMAAWSPRAGHVLVAVLPMHFHPMAGAPLPCLNAIELERIRDRLQAASSGGAAVAVRNAAYERIQVRCTVELMPRSQPGHCLQSLHAALDDWLSPWHATGNDARFDWVIRCKDVEAHLRTLPFVKSVAGLSLLRIAEDDFGNYTLADTARPDPRVDGKSAAGDAALRASWPWSVAVAMDWHLIEIAPSGRGLAADAAPQATGIGRLTVGGNYIVGRIVGPDADAWAGDAAGGADD